jgi:hypothetical protein
MSACSIINPSKETSNQTTDTTNRITITFPSDKYPNVADHIQDAINKGKPNTCTIDRQGAEQNRKESLKDVPTKKGYDRDEFPMAMCEEGGKGADIRYIKPKENRGAGSWFSNQVEQYPDGTVVTIDVQ